MILRLTFLVTSIFLSQSLFCQTQTLDKAISLINTDTLKSLKLFQEVLSEEKSPDLQLEIYKTYLKEIIKTTKNDHLLALLRQALSLPLNKKNHETYAELLLIKFEVQRIKGQQDSTLTLIDKLFEISHIYQNERILSRAYYQKAAILEEYGDGKGALEAYFEALRIARRSDNPIDLAKVQLEIAIFYESINNYKLALEYNYKALSSFKKVENGLASTARIYNNIGLIYDQTKNYDSAEYFLTKSYKIADSLKLKFGKYIISQNLGLVAYRKGEFDKARDILEEVLSFFKEQNDNLGMSLCYLNLARTFKDSGQIEKGISYAHEGLRIASKANLMNEMKELYQELSELYVKKSDYQSAYHYSNKYTELKDSLSNKDKSYEMGKLESKTELDKRTFENQLKDAKIEKQIVLRNGLIVGLGLLVIISLLIYRSQRIKAQSNRELEIKNKEIRDLEEAKTRWFVNVSHELKTPLTLIQGPVNRLSQSPGLSHTDLEQVNIAKRNIKQLNTLIVELLDLSKIENGFLKLEKSLTNFSTLVLSTVASFESLAEIHSITLEVDMPIDIWMELDASRVRKVVENMVSNALKFTPAGGEVTISHKKSDQHIKLIVNDTGEGISPEDLPFIFDRFYQSQKVKTAVGGTGIGLSLAQEIAIMHGGIIEVESTLEQGSRFTFKLPSKLLKSAPNDSSEPEKSQLKPLQASYTSRLNTKPKLLLVDDNVDMHNYIKSIMDSHYEITSASDGISALESLKKQKFDIIISDVMMPKMNGIELIKKVKSHAEWREIPFVILTALNKEEERIHTLRTGIDDYLGKPFNPEELQVRCSNLLLNRKQREESLVEVVSHDDKLLSTLELAVIEYMNDNRLSVNLLADKVAMSESSLRRYLKKATGLSPLAFIQEIKLQKACILLEKRAYPTVKEVASKVGFDRPARFSAAYEKRFGKKPINYLN